MILTTTGTLTASSCINTTNDNGEVSDTTYWAKLYEGLPLYIYDDDGTTVIGTYSYYVKETGVTMTINGEPRTFTYDSSNNNYIYTYNDETNTTYTYSISSAVEASGTTVTDSGTVEEGTYIDGTFTLTNTVSYSDGTTFYLPETGGAGTGRIYALAVLLLGVSGG